MTQIIDHTPLTTEATYMIMQLPESGHRAYVEMTKRVEKKGHRFFSACNLDSTSH